MIAVRMDPDERFRCLLTVAAKTYLSGRDGVLVNGKGKVRMSERQLELLTLEGSFRDIGYMHGKQGAERIRHFLELIVKHGIEMIPNFTKEKALSVARRYIPYIEDCAPHLAEEIRGIAEGAELSLESAYLLQLRAEVTQLTIENNSSLDCCTSFALSRNMTEDGEVWIGQNLDLQPFYKDFGVILRIRPKKGQTILCYSQIGSVGHAGINSAGIGLAVNALYSSGWRPGVPRPILYRLILEKESVSEALKAITEARRASSCNYMISHKSGEIKNIEATPRDYAVMNPCGGLMVHANHFEHPRMHQFEKRPKDRLENSKFREMRFKKLASDCGEKISPEKLKEFLADHDRFPVAICAHPEGNPWHLMTIASIIAHPSDALMHVASGQGCKNEYLAYSL